MNEQRQRRLQDRIREIVARMLERQIKDPRLGFVTVTDVRITADLRDATVFYTVYGDDADWEGTAAALASAQGLIRAEVGKQTGIKHTPTVAFQPDELPTNARHIDDLIHQARRRDEEVAQLAVDAQPIGDADPYRKPATDDEA
ncbi:MAG: 30S ribosome-binding factor RbfA [Streptosporangiales bacterium]|nr:30S ribosome-binding factor RbfA [Streptosporangiales bacterium]